MGVETYSGRCAEIDVAIDFQLLEEGVIDRLEWWDVEENNGNLTVVEAGVVGENVLDMHVVQIWDDGQDARKFQVSSSGVGM